MTQLFISEYIDGSTQTTPIPIQEKVIEIYNGTGFSVDLTNYTIRIYQDGATDPTYTISLSGSVANGDVFVISHSTAWVGFAEADMSSLDLRFDGNDALELFDGSTVIDVVGVRGVDPGTGWAVAGVTDGTRFHTLVRKSTVAGGNTSWTDSAGTDASNSEWIVHPLDYFTDLGQHTADSFKIVLSESTDVTPVTVKEGDAYVPFLRVKCVRGPTATLTKVDVTLSLSVDGDGDSDVSDDVNAVHVYLSTDTVLNRAEDTLLGTQTTIPSGNGVTVSVTGSYAFATEITCYIFILLDLNSNAGGNTLDVEQTGSASADAKDSYTFSETVVAGSHYSVSQAIEQVTGPEFMILSATDTGLSIAPTKETTWLALEIRSRQTPTVDSIAVKLTASSTTIAAASIDSVKVYHSSDALWDVDDTLIGSVGGSSVTSSGTVFTVDPNPDIAPNQEKDR